MSLTVVLTVRLFDDNSFHLCFDMSIAVLHHRSFISSINSLALLCLFFFTFDTDSKIQMPLLLIATDCFCFPSFTY